MTTLPPPDPLPERANDLTAAHYALLRTVDRRVSDSILDAMTEAGIACYIANPRGEATSPREVYVDATRTRTAQEAADLAERRFASRRVSIDADEVDARFAELIGSLGGPSDVPDPPAVTDDPRGDASAHRHVVDDARPEVWRASPGDSLEEPPDDEHFEPPPPEPIPKPTRKVTVGILLVIAGCVSLFAPGAVPISSTAAMVVGVVLLGAGIGWLVMQVRDRNDPFDDGSRV